MKPERFSGMNALYGSGQKEYHVLPAHVDGEGRVTSYWGLTFKEKLKLLFGWKIELSILTFGQALQPVRLMVVMKRTYELVEEEEKVERVR